MKITAILLLSTCLTASAGSLGQKVTLAEKNVRIDKILKEIKKQSGYVFFYKENLLEGTKPVSIRVMNAPVEEVLNEVLKSQQLEYSIIKKTVTITKRPVTFIPSEAIAPRREAIVDSFLIRGLITNADDNTPIQSVSVINPRSGYGAQTNKDGQFVIRVILGDKLQISHINYGTLTYEVKSNDNVIIKMTQKAAAETGEVVIVGFAKQKRSSLVSSVSTVSGDDLNFGGRNLSNNIQGKVSGIISFQRSGEPGYDNATFWIRGISTTNGVQNPLVLVDGVPRSFNDVDPNEIATFTVLKDAAATAPYGTEGANGVILVTTKRGRIQKTAINYQGEYSTLSPLRMPQFVGSAEYLSAYNEALANENKQPVFSPDLINKYATNADPDLYPSTDWLGVLLKKNTYNTRHTMSFRGGTSKARYFVSGAYYKESGLFNSNPLSQYNSNIDLKRYNLRSNIDLDITNTTLLRIDLSGQYLATNYPGVGTGTILQLATTAPPYLFPAIYSDGTIADHPRSSNNRVNPYNLLTNSGYTNEFRSNIQSRIDLEQKLDVLTKGLVAKVSVSYDYYGQYNVSTSKSFNSYFATGRRADSSLIFQQIKTGTGNVVDNGTSFSATKNIYLEGSLSYARMFGSLHDVTALLLTYQKESQPSSQRLPYRKQAYVGRVTYAYDKRYSVELNTGITGSENFSKNYRFGVFPAAGVSWFASNEHFYPEGLKKIVSSLKFRASYGISGNDQLIDPATGQVIRFPYRGTFSSSGGTSLGYTAGGSTASTFGGLIEGRFSYPSITWEKEKKKNFGIDIGLFGNKLNITADYFDNYRYDILVLRQTVSGATGFRQNPAQNYGIVTNKGVDGSVTYQQQFGKSIVGFRGNFTLARNKIIQIDEIPQPFPWMSQTGNRLNMPGLFVADRLFEESDFDITTNPDGSKNYVLQGKYASQTYFGPVLPGDIKYKDLNGDGVINQYDQTRYTGNPTTPEITYGFGFSYGYKGWSINAFFAGIANASTVLGADNPQGFFPFTYSVDEASLRTIARDRWTAANPSQNVLFPRIRTSSFYNNSAPSTWWQRDASFIRLKNVEIGYEVPEKLIRKLKISRLKAYAMGYNLITWDHIKYWDPEQGNANAGLNYPQSRTFTFGLEVGL